MKKCSKCKKEKLVTDFAKNSKNKDGLYGYCKKCKARQDEIYRYVKSRQSLSYIQNSARMAALDAL
jgi:hypothetical protein